MDNKQIIELVKKIRNETGLGIMEIKAALEEAAGDMKKAQEILRKKGFEKAAKKGDRETGQGLVESYVHANGKVGVLVSLLCETDFVARTDEFKALAHEVAMQIAAMNPKSIDVLLKQEYIRDGSKTIDELIKETIAKVGENIKLGDFKRSEI